MEQSDLLLLHTVPSYHLQSIIKARLATQISSAGASDLTTPTLPELAESIFEPRSCREALHALNEAEACVLRELVACGGRANSRDLALYLSSSDSPFAAVPTQGKSGPASSTAALTTMRPAASSLYPAPHPHGPFEQALHRLLTLGLLFWGKQTNFVGRDYANGVYDGVLIVPQTIAEIARREWRLGELQMPVAVEKDVMPGENMHTLQRALYLYWSLVASLRDGLPLLNSHLLSRIAMRQVLEHLSSLDKFAQGLIPEQAHTESDAPYLLFLRLLLMKLGLLTERQGAVHAAPAREFFALPLVERAWRCFHLWLESSFWNELAFIPDVVVRPGPAPLDPAHEEVIYSRLLVVDHVLRTTPETWHTLSTFVAYMKLHVPYLLFPRQYGARAERYSLGSNPYGWDFRLRRGWLTHREGWHQVEGGFIRTLLTGPLMWLGIVELDGVGHPDAFCLAQGAGLLASSALPVSADLPGGRLVVQPNFDLVALAPVSESLLVDLDTFAERVRLEHIAQYRLNKASVMRAVQLGLTAETIARTLEQAAGGPIPQNVQYSLLEWERQARRIEIWQGTTLLEIDDPGLLDELFDSPETRAWLVRRLSPTMAEVAGVHLARLQELLWQRDYLPALTSAAQYQDLLSGAPLPTREAQWSLLPDGLFQPLYPLSDLYLATELEHFTVIDEATGWRRLTPFSLQQALTSGLEFDAIIHFLQHYCAGGVPGSFLIRLKLWGDGYSEPTSLQVESTPLLSLAAALLPDILADEEIGPLLGAALPPAKRLVRVSPEHLERVIELLKERGFEIS
ncbi:MAG TPA: helicase-associated domain-containing protein [Ktedonobacteraceae bacterium]|nr:helicase-associated domain-containing protein [Ktedonobacteraceae bacterium]